MDENPYRSPQPHSAGAVASTVQGNEGHERSLRDAFLSGIKIGGSIGLVFGVLTDFAVLATIADGQPRNLSDRSWAVVALVIVVSSTMVGGLGCAFGFGLFAFLDRFVQPYRRRSSSA
jgi:hypothetical protein